MHDDTQGVYLTHFGEFELLILWALLSLIWSLGAQAPGRRRGVLRYVGFLGTSFLLCLLGQVADGVPVVRWSISGGILGMLVYAVGLAIHGVASSSAAHLLRPASVGAGAPRAWSSYAPATRTRMLHALRRNQEYLGLLAQVSCGLLALSAAGTLATASSPHGAGASWLLVGTLACATLGLMFGLELASETLRWIEDHQGEAFWSRHAWRGASLVVVPGLLFLGTTSWPAVLFQGMLLICLVLAPRYLLGASFLGQFHAEVTDAGAVDRR
jgi:hypothetical protein